MNRVFVVYRDLRVLPISTHQRVLAVVQDQRVIVVGSK